MSAVSHTTIGAFVLGGTILALGTIIFFGRVDLFSYKSRVAVVFEDSISGLTVGAPVTFRGVQVGVVDGILIQFDPASHTASIPVTATIDTALIRVAREKEKAPLDIRKLVDLGLRAQLNIQSFVTGQSVIDLNFTPETPAILHPKVTDLLEIPTEPSTIQKVKEQLSQLPLRELADNANVTLQSLSLLSGKLDRDLPPLVASLKATSDRSAEALDVATHAISDLQQRLALTLGHVDRLAATSDRQLTARGQELHALLVSSNQTMLQARDLAASLKDLTADRAAVRTNLDSALRDLAAAAASMRGFARDIEHDPQLLLTGRRP